LHPHRASDVPQHLVTRGAVNGGASSAARSRFAADSLLEGEGFEPSVPREGNYARERPRLVCGAAGRGRAARRWRDWQREGGGLAGTGLRDTTQIAPAEHRRDGLELNGRGCRIAFCGEGARIGAESPRSEKLGKMVTASRYRDADSAFAEDNAPAGDDPRDEGCPDVGRG
jgi:hypothetical protein